MSLKNVHTRKLLDVLRTVRSRQSLVITQYHERTKGDEVRGGVVVNTWVSDSGQKFVVSYAHV